MWAIDPKNPLYVISNQLNDSRSAQLANTSKIVVSQKSIQEGLCNLTNNLEDISSQLGDIVGGLENIDSTISQGMEQLDMTLADGFSNLNTTLEWGFSEVVWRLNLQNEHLRDIVHILKTPLATQALELRSLGVNAYQNGWIDDALKDFKDSEEKNRYDFTVLQSIGNIYLFYKNDLGNALQYYEKAAIYALPVSKPHATIAYLHIGKVHYLQNDFEKAYKAAEKAIKCSPENGEALYQLSTYCSRLGKSSEAIKYLKKAIIENEYYCVASATCPDFNGMKNELETFLKKLHASAEHEAQHALSQTRARLEELASISPITIPLRDFAKPELERIKELCQRSGILDYWQASREAFLLRKSLLSECKEILEKKTEEVSSELQSVKENVKKQTAITKINSEFWRNIKYLIFFIILGGLGLLMLIDGIRYQISNPPIYNLDSQVGSVLKIFFGGWFSLLLLFSVGIIFSNIPKSVGTIIKKTLARTKRLSAQKEAHYLEEHVRSFSASKIAYQIDLEDEHEFSRALRQRSLA